VFCNSMAQPLSRLNYKGPSINLNSKMRTKSLLNKHRLQRAAIAIGIPDNGAKDTVLAFNKYEHLLFQKRTFHLRLRFTN
jgi:hypothetical protein